MKILSWLALGALSLLLASMAVQAEDSTSTGRTQSIQSRAEMDTAWVAMADSAQAMPDSTAAPEPDQRSPFARLVQPLMAMALAGGILLLLFTQRGR